jgi:hypothetical protein
VSWALAGRPNRRGFQYLCAVSGWRFWGFFSDSANFPRYSPRYFCVIFPPLRVLVAVTCTQRRILPEPAELEDGFAWGNGRFAFSDAFRVPQLAVN